MKNGSQNTRKPARRACRQCGRNKVYRWGLCQRHYTEAMKINSSRLAEGVSIWSKRRAEMQAFREENDGASRMEIHRLLGFWHCTNCGKRNEYDDLRCWYCFIDRGESA